MGFEWVYEMKLSFLKNKKKTTKAHKYFSRLHFCKQQVENHIKVAYLNTDKYVTGVLILDCFPCTEQLKVNF